MLPITQNDLKPFTDLLEAHAATTKSGQKQSLPSPYRLNPLCGGLQQKQH
jgi:hypothetical protein